MVAAHRMRICSISFLLLPLSSPIGRRSVVVPLALALPSGATSVCWPDPLGLCRNFNQDGESTGERERERERGRK